MFGNFSPVRQFGDDINEGAVCPVAYSSPPGSGPMQPSYGGGGGHPLSGPRGPPSGNLSDVGNLSGRASLADDFSQCSSPAHSIVSDVAYEGYPGAGYDGSPLHGGDYPLRRLSLDQASEPARRAAGGQQSRNELRNFLPRDQMSLTPPQGGGSPIFEYRPRVPEGSGPRGSAGTTPLFGGGSHVRTESAGGGSPLFPSLPSKPLSGGSSPMRGATPAPLGGSPLFTSYSQYNSTNSPLQPQQQQQQQQQQGAGGVGRGGPSGASPAHQRMTGLREQVLIRSSSGQSSEFARVDSSQAAEPGVLEYVEAECLNFSETESVCQEQELEKRTVDGVMIVPLSSRLSMGADSSEIVLYALFFSDKDTVPFLPGDQSVKLLFPKSLQDAAEGNVPKRGTRKGPVSSKVPMFECKPYEQMAAPSAAPKYAAFGEYKPQA